MNEITPVKILLVEDNPGDVELIKEALEINKVCNELRVAGDGVEAIDILHRAGDRGGDRPDLILLDLNLPRKDGREVLAEIKADDRLKHIPVVVLTTSGEAEDIVKAYDLNANCYITKPVDLEQFVKVVRSIDEFWFGIVKLPPA